MNEANINFLASLSSRVRYSLYEYKKNNNPNIDAPITLKGPTSPKTQGKSENGINIKADNAILNAEVFDFPDPDGNK